MILVFFTVSLTGYNNELYSALAYKGYHVVVYTLYEEANAPFSFDTLNYKILRFESLSSVKCFLDNLFKKGDVILYFSGWSNFKYNLLAMLYRKRQTYLMFDTPWRADLRQFVGLIPLRAFFTRAFNGAVVPGTPQVIYASRLGFKLTDITTGLYCTKTQYFGVFEEREISKDYIFIGRLVSVKGIDILAKAWKVADSENTLNVAGVGPLAPKLSVLSNVTMLGFVQPADLTKYLQFSQFLIIPSLYEPWGLILQEGLAAGLIILARRTVQSSYDLLIDNYNGYLWDTDKDLVELIKKCDKMEKEEKEVMSKRSFELSQITKVDILVEKFVNIAKE